MKVGRWYNHITSQNDGFQAPVFLSDWRFFFFKLT